MNENIIPWSISAISLLFVILSFVRNGTKDSVSQVKEDNKVIDSIKENNIKMNSKLDMLCSNTNQILIKFEKHEDKIQSLETAIAVLERDVKTAFNKIDEMKGK